MYLMPWPKLISVSTLVNTQCAQVYRDYNKDKAEELQISNPIHNNTLTFYPFLKESSPATLFFIDAMGKLVHQQMVDELFLEKKTIDLPHLAPGMYVIYIKTNSNLYKHKIIITN